MKLTFKDCLKIGGSIFLLYLAVHYWETAIAVLGTVVSAAMPLIIGAVVAYLVNILMANYERHYFPKAKNGLLIKSRRPVCMLLAFLTLIAIVVMVVWLIVPQLGDCFGVILDAVPGFMRKVIDIVEALNIVSADTISYLEGIDWNSLISRLVQVVSSGIGSVMDVLIGAVSSVFSGIVTGLLSLIFSFYLLSGKEKIGSQLNRIMKRYLPEKANSRIHYFLQILNDCFHRYIVGQCTEAVILGVLCAVGMWILQLPYAAMIGALVAFTALIPVAGAYIGAGVGAFMILTVDPIKAVVFLVFIVVLQQLEGNLIYPRVVGSSMGLPGIWVLAAVTVGGGIMGIGGMLLGVPLAAALYRIIKEDVRKHELPAAAAVGTELPESPEQTAE